MGRFYNCGQACLAIKRVYVFDAVADQVAHAIAAKAARLRLGIGSDPGSQMGPLHSARQRGQLERQIAQTLQRGGEVLTGGGRPDDPQLANGFFHQPTVILDPPKDSPMAREEVFGPALPIWRVADLDEALALANDSPFGLGSSVWTADLNSAERAAAELDCGYTWINSRTKVYDELPFGGLKRAAATARSTDPRRWTSTPIRSRSWCAAARPAAGASAGGARRRIRPIRWPNIPTSGPKPSRR